MRGDAMWCEAKSRQVKVIIVGSPQCAICQREGGEIMKTKDAKTKNYGTNLAAWQQAKQPCNKIKKTCRLSFDPRIYYDHGTTTISTWTGQDKLWSHKIPTKPAKPQPTSNQDELV